MLMAFAVSLSMAQTISLTAYQKNKTVNADSVYEFNPTYIVSCYSISGITRLEYDYNKLGNTTLFFVRQPVDSVLKYSNNYSSNLVKLKKAMSFGGKVDSFNTYLFNIKNIKGFNTGTTPPQTSATSKLLYKAFGNMYTFPIIETKARIKTVIDSTVNLH